MPSNQHTRNKKQVYINLKLIDGNEELTSMIVYENQTSEEIKQLLTRKCDIMDDSLILKLRNYRGSVIPFSYQSLTSNTREEPFSLEAVKPHSTLPLDERSIENDATYSIEVKICRLSGTK